MTLISQENIDRRQFLRKSGACLAGIALGQSWADAAEGKAGTGAGRRPNVLLLHTDQLRRDALSVYGRIWRSSGRLIETPHLDRLAVAGARFDDFYTPAPVCCPSRASMLTGRYPHEHTVVVNEEVSFGAGLPESEISLGTAFKSQGYATAYFGKWHLSNAGFGFVPPEKRHGFDYWFGANRGHPKDPYIGYRGNDPTELRIPGYTTEVLADDLCRYIRTNRDRPFAAVSSWPDPHSPYWITAPYRNQFDWRDVPLPLNYLEDESLLPQWALDIREGSMKLVRDLMKSGSPDTGKGYTRGAKNPREAFQMMTAQYWAMVKCIDDNVGKVLACLESEGILDDTIIAFTTDHGEFMGSHGLLFKGYMYDEAIRLPLLMRYPRVIPPGTVVHQRTSMIDLMPTLLDMAGAPIPKPVTGRSFATLAAGGKVADWPDEVFLSLYDSRAIRDGRYTYQLNRTAPTHLFDHKSDPLETRNAIDDPEHREAVGRLHSRLAAWLQAHDDDVVKVAAAPRWFRAYPNNPAWPATMGAQARCSIAS